MKSWLKKLNKGLSVKRIWNTLVLMFFCQQWRQHGISRTRWGTTLNLSSFQNFEFVRLLTSHQPYITLIITRFQQGYFLLHKLKKITPKWKQPAIIFFYSVTWLNLFVKFSSRSTTNLSFTIRTGIHLSELSALDSGVSCLEKSSKEQIILFHGHENINNSLRSIPGAPDHYQWPHITMDWQETFVFLSQKLERFGSSHLSYQCNEPSGGSAKTGHLSEPTISWWKLPSRVPSDFSEISTPSLTTIRIDLNDILSDMRSSYANDNRRCFYLVQTLPTAKAKVGIDHGYLIYEKEINYRTAKLQISVKRNSKKRTFPDTPENY